MKLFFNLFLFISFSLQAQTLSFNPFSNKLFLWDGTTFINAFDQEESYTIFFSDVPNTFQTPVALSEHQFVVSSNQGEIFILDLKEQKSLLYYHSKDRCRFDLGFSGCIYSLLVTPQKEILYLVHQRDQSDTLMRNKQELITNVPAPSGPIWIRPNGNLGLLPYGHGLYELELPLEKSNFSNTVVQEISLETMAAMVGEGITGEEVFKTYIYDFSAIKILKTNHQFANLTQASNALYDPCFGRIWFQESESIKHFRVSPNPAACPLTIRWNIESKSSPKGSSLKQAHRFWDLPQGTPYTPNPEVFSLGYQGDLTLVASTPIHNAPGIDLRIFENAFIAYGNGKIFSEVAMVELFDGTNWTSTGCDCQHPTTDHCAGMQVTSIMPGDGILPWSASAGGFGIDLELFQIDHLEKIRLIDCGTISDSGWSGGFDLDAISINPNSF